MFDVICLCFAKKALYLVRSFFFHVYNRGIPFVSKDRQLRVEAIGEFLANGGFDVVSLQEVWSEHDYQLLKKRTENTLPFAHYFYR